MHRYWCYGHHDGHITTLQTNNLPHAQEWCKQNVEEGLRTFIIDCLTGKPLEMEE